MNLQALGDKLQRYRIQLQRTVDEVAAFTAINVERLSSIEKGALEPTGDEVLILADYYRCDFKFFISNEQVAPFEDRAVAVLRCGSKNPFRLKALIRFVAHNFYLLL